MADLERRLVNREPGPLVIAISDYVARQLQTHYGVDSARIRRVFNGADPDVSSFEQKRADRTQVRRQLGLADDDYVLLAVAHNFKLKGIGPLIQALRQVRPANTFAVIVGRDDPTPYARMARESGLQDRIIFTGPTQRVSAFYHAADVVVHPTYYDPCSRVVLEALGAGTPTITTRFNGAAEVIVDGTHGFVIDTPDDLPALADRIERLADPELREQCAAAAPSAVAGVTMEAHAQGVLRVYEEIIRSGGFARQGGK
jgi:UDP-glucose:(heptosyl)LPS alpha-1,3-glucosyltransferase